MTGFVQNQYFFAPEDGLPGQITDIKNPFTTFPAVAEEQLDVGIAVAQGADLDDPLGQMGFKVKRPTTTPPADVPIGITVRIANLQGEPVNTQASVPVYRTGDLVTYLTKGSIWILTPVEIDASGRNAVYVVNNVASTYPLGTLLPTDDTGNAVLYDNAYFERKTPAGGIVKVVFF
jgi:hypothetical protein